MKDYKRILQGVVNIINITKKSDIGFANICSYIGENCPELKESEDERMVQYFKDLAPFDKADELYDKYGFSHKDAIAWLEKQGDLTIRFFTDEFEWALGRIIAFWNQNHKDGKYDENELMSYIKVRETELVKLFTDNVCKVSLSDCTEEYRKAYYDGYNKCNRDWLKIKDISVDEYNKNAEILLGGQGEQKPTDKIEPKFHEGDKIQYKKYTYTIKEVQEDCYVLDDDKVLTFNAQDVWELIEQKSTNKVEPKFKQGEWIIFNGLILYVDEVVQGYYRTISIDGIPNSYDWDIDNAARLWTIQEAKAGDVLSYRDGQWIFIYKGIVTKDVFKYYALLSEKGIFVDDEAFSLLSSCITPATKEQRDTLMKAMTDAGYTFDFEKKELKKIEQKPAEWSEVRFTSTIQVLEFAYSLNSYNQYGKENIRKNIVWLKSLKDRVQPQNTWKPSEDLPHWKKGTLKGKNVTGFNSDFFSHNGYYINYNELFDKLPKDE